MTPYSYRTIEGDPTAALRGNRSTLYAGGTDLLPLLKAGLVDVGELADLKNSDLASDVVRHDDRWEVGALTTLADLEDHAELSSVLPVIAEAVKQAATRQIRNRATVGGNLLQRPRCAYFRNEAIGCLMKGGEGCPARHGRNAHHTIFQSGPCVAPQPSDLASALVALDAEVTLIGTSGERRVAINELLTAPSEERPSLNSLGPDELVQRIEIPTTAGGVTHRSTYRKAMDRQAFAFALVGLAVSLTFDERDVVTDARLVASGVASTPWSLHGAQHAITGTSLDASSIHAACDAAVDGAEPLSENGYKVPLLQGLLRRALSDLAH